MRSALRVTQRAFCGTGIGSHSLRWLYGARKDRPEAIDEELLELADGTTTVTTMGILLGISEAPLLARIDKLSRLGFFDDASDLRRTREWAIDTLVDADPPAFDDE